ncbi:hypothetical protein MRX96_014885 [Rhipicephalus microplus]
MHRRKLPPDRLRKGHKERRKEAEENEHIRRRKAAHNAEKKTKKARSACEYDDGQREALRHTESAKRGAENRLTLNDLPTISRGRQRERMSEHDAETQLRRAHTHKHRNGAKAEANRRHRQQIAASCVTKASREAA